MCPEDPNLTPEHRQKLANLRRLMAVAVDRGNAKLPRWEEPLLNLVDDVTSVDPETGSYSPCQAPIPASIRNCWFSFECPVRWEALAATLDPDVRNCGRCDRDVLLWRTETEFNRHAAAKCVTVPVPDDRGGSMMVGKPESPPYRLGDAG